MAYWGVAITFWINLSNRSGLVEVKLEDSKSVALVERLLDSPKIGVDALEVVWRSVWLADVVVVDTTVEGAFVLDAVIMVAFEEYSSISFVSTPELINYS